MVTSYCHSLCGNEGNFIVHMELKPTTPITSKTEMFIVIVIITCLSAYIVRSTAMLIVLIELAYVTRCYANSFIHICFFFKKCSH